MIIRPCDLETTGLEASDEVVEIGHYDIYDGRLDLTSGRKLLIRPAREIPAVASAIHHITAADVADAPVWADAWRMLVDTRDDGEELIFAAHMAQYERQYLDPLIKARWICTWKASLRLWPHLESHSLQTIRYALALPVDAALAMPPHRALPDAYLCGVLLVEILKIVPVETLIEWSSEPALFSKFDFGQYKGKPLSAADDGYLEWMATKADQISADWKWNAKREIERRAGAAAAKVLADRQTYLEQSLVGVAGAASIRDLENWFLGQSDHWAKHGILAGSAEYSSIVAACAQRKAALQAAGEPQFGEASA